MTEHLEQRDFERLWTAWEDREWTDFEGAEFDEADQVFRKRCEKLGLDAGTVHVVFYAFENFRDGGRRKRKP